MENSLEIILQRTEWFRQDSIWDVYSFWSLCDSLEGENGFAVMRKMTIEDYQPYFDTFNPR